MAEAHILLVEDDADLREALLDTLLLAHYECVDVSNNFFAKQILEVNGVYF